MQEVAVQLTLEMPAPMAIIPPKRRHERPIAPAPPPVRLTLGDAARIIREAMKDKSYRSTPLGQLVGRYLRWFRNEYGATESTLRDYEAVLARSGRTGATSS